MTFAVEKAFGGQKIMLAEVQAKLAAAEKQVSSGKILPAKEALAITINLDRKAVQPVRLSFHLVPKLQ